MPASDKYQVNVQNVAIIENKKKDIKPTDDRLYQGIFESREDLTSYLATIFTEYGITDKLEKANYTITHESSWIWYADNGISKGIASFIPSTWKSYCSGDYNDMNPHEQLRCFSKMWSMGLEYHWDAYCLHYWDINCVEKRHLHP